MSPAGSVVWRVIPSGGNPNAGAYITAAATIGSDGFLYFGDWMGNFNSISAATGDFNPGWTRGPYKTSTGAIVSSAVLTSDCAIFGADDGFIYSVSLSDGAEAWKFRTGDIVETSPALGTVGASNDIVYLGSFDKFMYAIRASTGSQVWKSPLTNRAVGGAAIAPSGDVVFYSDSSSAVSYFYAVVANTGTQLWRYAVKNGIWMTPTVDANGNPYISAQSGLVYGLDGLTGKVRWTYVVGGGQAASSGTLSSDGVLYFGCTNSKIVALNSATGQEMWVYTPPNLNLLTAVEFQSTVAMDSTGALYFGAGDYNVYKLVNAPPSPPPSRAPTAIPTFTNLPTMIPTPSPSAVPTIRPTIFPSGVPTPPPTNNPSFTPTTAPPTSIPTYRIGQGLSMTAVAMMSDCTSPATGLVTPEQKFIHLTGPNPRWFLTVQIYGTGISGGLVNQGRVETTLNGKLIPISYSQPPACFCASSPDTRCPNPIPQYRQSILNYEIPASAIVATDGGQITLQTTAFGFCQSACPYQGLYDLYVRYALSGSVQGPTFEPSPAGVVPTFLPTANPSIPPTPAPSPVPTTLRPSALPTLNPTTPPPTARPTLFPTFFKATSGPTSAQPTFSAWSPTPSPSRNLLPLICPPYFATGTDSARNNYAECQVFACPGQTFTVGDCTNGNRDLPGQSCQGDQLIRVFGTLTNPQNEVGSNDDFCGLCSQVTITVPQNYVCQVFTIREGCAGMQTCGGVMAVSGDIMPLPNGVRLVPITPTLAPSSLPTTPTLVPTTLPTAQPTLFPTYLPGVPTPAPSIQPTNPTPGPTTTPTTAPTSPTALPTTAPTYLPEVPTPVPSMQPTTLPTAFPSPLPTTAPSPAPPPQVQYCSSFSGASNCAIQVCGGVTFSVSTCPSAAAPAAGCVGPDDLRLADSAGVLLSVNLIEARSCGNCAGFTYTTPFNAPCAMYLIRQNCLGAGSVCQGTAAIFAAPGAIQMLTLVPTAQPTTPSALPTAPPTFPEGAATPDPTAAPTSVSPTPYPSFGPTIPPPTTIAPTQIPTLYCPQFSASGTDTDRVNPQVCGIRVVGPICSQVQITATTCSAPTDPNAGRGGYCVGKSVLRLFDENHVEQAVVKGSGDNCGDCDGFTFTTAWNAPCQMYYLDQGCVMGSACGGVTAISFSPNLPLFDIRLVQFAPTAMPTALPTAQPDVPTFMPTPVPTAVPTFTPFPTAFPTIAPTAVPTPIPSAPSIEPSAAPTYLPGTPTPMPSFAPIAVPTTMPSPFPTSAPSSPIPSSLPTPGPTAAPTAPTMAPTPFPTYLPGVPTPKPTDFPLSPPSAQPTVSPTVAPTLAPSLGPTIAPSRPTMNPTRSPTYMVTVPTPDPTSGAPSILPTPVPTTLPSPLSEKIDLKTCPLFTARDTNSDKSRFAPVCGVYACPGTTFTISMCPRTPGTRCAGDPILRIWANSNQSFVAMNDNGPADQDCGLCPQLTYSTTLPCQVYVIREGCMGSSGCGGSASITAPFEAVRVLGNGSALIPLFPPTMRPTNLPPTKKPTRAPTYLPNSPTPQPSAEPSAPTFLPTLMPTMPFICPPYAVNNTNSGNDGVNTATCSIYMCPGTTVTIGSCQGVQNNGFVNRCQGDEVLRLFNSAGNQVAWNDDACGSCSQIVFTPTQPCQVYQLREGCYGNSQCSGQPLVFGAQVVSMIPTAVPTALPSFTPAPSANPTPVPSYLPNAPTIFPTVLPSPPPTFFNFFTPTPPPSFQPLSCKTFYAHNTDTDSTKFATCGVYACPGATFTVSTCKSNYAGARCIGDTFLQLFDQASASSVSPTVLASNDNGPGNCGLCSEFSYTTTLPCQTYVISQGCMGVGNCAGDTVIAGNTNGFDVVTFNPTKKGTPYPSPIPSTEPTTIPTTQPTQTPTYLKGKPTPQPSSLPTAPSPQPSLTPTAPSPAPSVAPTTAQICPPFSVSFTQSNTVNYAICSFVACQGASIRISSCDPGTGLQASSCKGDQMYSLYDQTGYTQRAINDNTCGLCSQIQYMVTDPGCQVFGLRQGCKGNSSCSGTTIITGTPIGSFYLATQPGTQVPTLSPTITPLPTFSNKAPTPEPTFQVTQLPMQVQLAPQYFADMTNSDTVRAPAIGVYACPGTTFTVSTCPVVPGAFCQGDTYLRMFSSDGTLVAENDNGAGPCGLCAQFTFTGVGGCQVYSVAEGCASNRQCNGIVGIQAVRTSVNLILFSPTLLPTSGPPTTIPTALPSAFPDVPTMPPTANPTAPTPFPTMGPTNPTRAPTAVETLPMFCPPYTATNTNFGLDRNYVTCSITACGGSTLTVGNCAATDSPSAGCVGDQLIRLFDSSGQQVATNDDYCGMCAQITYVVPGLPNECTTYVLREGCWGNSDCGGVMSVAGGGIVVTKPTPMPTQRPTMPYIAGSPTFQPTPTAVVPTTEPTPSALTCMDFVAGQTADNTVGFSTCGIYACAGTTFTVSMCPETPGASCDGDTMLTMMSANGTMVASNDDGVGDSCGLCSMFTFTATAPCQTYILREGCHGDDACRGTVAVGGSNINLGAVDIVDFFPTLSPTRAPTQPTLSPTPAPSVVPSFGPSTAPSYLPWNPTPVPTLDPTRPTVPPTPQPSNPTAVPTLQPTFGQICPPYSASNTNNALENFAVCGVYACPGTTVTISNCGLGCVGDQFLRLVDSISSKEVAFDDDGCGGSSQCSRLTYTVPAGMCKTFFIHEGCHDNGQCEGVVNFIGNGGSQPAILATAVPTPLSTFAPTFVHTNSPTPLLGSPTANPTMVPTEVKLLSSQYCLLFQSQITALSQNFPFCSFYICPGTTVTLSTCSQTDGLAQCSGDPYMKLYDSKGIMIKANDNGPAGCGGCSQMTYTSSLDSCQILTVKEGCQGGQPCTGTLAVVAPSGAVAVQTYAPTLMPTGTVMPSTGPTPQPSALPTFPMTPHPTALPGIPTDAPSVPPSTPPSPMPSGPTAPPTLTLPQFCPPYLGSMTNTTQRNFWECAMQVCPGQNLVIGGCGFAGPGYSNPIPGAGCRGDQYIRLYDEFDRQIAIGDDECGLCSQITYTVPGNVVLDTNNNPLNCVTYILDQGCYGNATCGGVTGVYGGALIVPLQGYPTFLPTSMPPTPVPTLTQTSQAPTTAAPTNPTAVPTQSPTYLPGVPTPQPSVLPSPAPSAIPTEGPTALPTAGPSFHPTPQPTQPTALPTLNPTYTPGHPTPQPTALPSSEPTVAPTPLPSVSPTPVPSNEPTVSPTAAPTLHPTLPTALPTLAPTYTPGAPTPLPSVLPSPMPTALPTTQPTPTGGPTVVPTVSPTPSPSPIDQFIYTDQPTVRGSTYLPTTYGVIPNCDRYSALDTNNGQQNTVLCGLYICGGVTVTLSMCPGLGSISQCVNDPLLRLVNGQGLEVAFNDNAGSIVPGCGVCPQITYTTPGTEGGCQVYALNQGCAGNGRCGGIVSISAVQGSVEHRAIPGTLSPTLQPSSVPPTVVPTPTPSIVPSPRPSRIPRTIRPTTFKSPAPSRRGQTREPTRSWEGSDLFTEIPAPANPLVANMGLTGQTADAAAGSSFGRVLAMNSLTLAVGSPTMNRGMGMVELFDCTPMVSQVSSGCKWAATLQNGGNYLGRFGSAIGMGYGGSRSNVLVVGSPGSRFVRIYDTTTLVNPSLKTTLNGRDWTQATSSQSSFGESVVLYVPSYTNWTTPNPLILTVGDRIGGDGRGIAYVYIGRSNNLGMWSQLQRLAPSGSSEVMFGSPMAKNNDGLLAVGSTTGNSVLIYIYALQTDDAAPGFQQLGSPLTWSGSVSFSTTGSNFLFSLTVNTGNLALGLPSANNGNGLAVLYQWSRDANSGQGGYLEQPVGMLLPDDADTAGRNSSVRAQGVGFGQTVTITNRVGAAALAVSCPGCGGLDPRGSVYIYMCANPANCGAANTTYSQLLFMDFDNVAMDLNDRNALAFSSTGAVLAVGAPPSFNNQGAVLIYNGVRFPFTTAPTSVPSKGPTRRPSFRPSLRPSLFPTTVPSPYPTSPRPTTSVPIVVTIIVHLSISVPSMSANSLKNTLDTNLDWQNCIRGAVIETVQGESYLRNLTVVTSLTSPLFTNVASRVQVIGEKQENRNQELMGQLRRLQKSASTKGAPVYLTLTVQANMWEARGATTHLQLESAFAEVQDDFKHYLEMRTDDSKTPPISFNEFTTTLRTVAANPPLPLVQATVLAMGPPLQPNMWTERLGEGYVDTGAPTVIPTPEPTPYPTAEPTPAKTVIATQTVAASELNKVTGTSGALSNPAVLGGVAAGVILLFGLAAFALFLNFRSGKDDEQDLMQGAGGYSDQGQDQPEYLHDDDYVERPSGGVEMLENPVHRRASQPFQQQQYMGQEDDMASQAGGYDGTFTGAPSGPPRAGPADPYQRFGLAGGPGAVPQQRLSMSIRGAMTTEITGPGTAPQAREPMKKFSVAPTLAEFTQTNVAARLGMPRPEFTTGPMPAAPRLLKPFQPHSAIAPVLPLGSQGHQPQAAPTTITLSPSKRLDSKLQQQRDSLQSNM